MLKRLIAVILTCVLLWSGAALAEIEFDISVFAVSYTHLTLPTILLV